MNSFQAEEKAIVDSEPEALPPLRGRPLRFVRVAWVVLAFLALSVFIVSVPVHFRQHVGNVSRDENPTLATVVFLLAAHTVAINTITVLAFSLAAAAIFWRSPRDRMVVLVSTAMLTIGVAVAPTLDTLLAVQTGWQWAIYVVRGLGVGLVLLVFYLFPNGQFVPHWTRILAFVWVGWLLAWAFLPTSAPDPDRLPLALRFLVFFISSDPAVYSRWLLYIRIFSVLVVTLGWFGSGVFAQIYRYKHVSSPLQRQQTKWVVFGLTAAVVGYFGFQVPLSLVPGLHSPGTPQLLFRLIGGSISTLLLLLAPLSISVSVLRRRLWDIDPIIKNTMIYGTLTGGVAVVYIGCVLVFQRLFRALTGQQSDLAIVVATLISAALAQPLRRRLQNFIDRRFYRERVDFRRAFTSFSREVRTIIELPELLDVLIERTTALLHIAHGTVFLLNSDGTFQRTESRDTSTPGPDPPGHEPDKVLSIDNKVELSLAPSELGQLRNGRVISQPKQQAFTLLVPLIAPRREGSELVGVLALGTRLSGQDYSREDYALLMGLADQAGTAIYVARLIQEKQEEARRREEVEHRLEAYRNSPLGRAEAFAQDLFFEPQSALVGLHRLAQAAGQDPNSASLLDNLPRVLDSLGADPIADLAEGFNYLYTSQFEPEVLPVGLRILITQLEDYPEDAQYVCKWDPDGTQETEQQNDIRSDGLHYRAEALDIYRLCQAALQANSIAQITQLLPSLENGSSHEEKDTAAERATTIVTAPFQTLGHALGGLRPAADALYAYERMDTSRDKLAYLASAVERLRRVDYLARAELSSADRPIMQRITESWLAVVTGAISELQTRAQIVCRLLTRHTWQEDAVPLVLSLRNDGRGTAFNLKINLLPASEYTLLDEGAQVEQIAPGEEVRVELLVRPHLTEGVNQFRARFVILYTDPRGADQVENFADVVRLLKGGGEFQFIPNPYVVGTPLEAGSPLFFGREDVVTFIQENMAALHRNNLVLIGQRRTGKTSLLKQLPARLGDDYLPVYLDGQALGLDPGLPNFFLSLATEIAFALEDRGFGIDLPEYNDFAESPAASFDRRFLARVREIIEHRHLLIMFDEFEELETAVQRGNLEPSIFGFLRHMIQHGDNLSVIFCGTHRLEELASDYWSVLFNISLYRQIAFLEKPDAMHLIQEPVAEYGMRYDDLALDKMWQVTSGHPYFLQLLCHSLVNRHNKTKRNYATVADVNAALEEILALGEAHFVYLWTDASPEDRLVLAALSRMIPLTGHITPVQVADYLAERSLNLERRTVSDALHRLALRDILTVSSEVDLAMGEVYRWRLGLLGLWVEKYRSISRVIEEVRGR